MLCGDMVPILRCGREVQRREPRGQPGPAGEEESSVMGGGVVKRPTREKLMSRAGWQLCRGNAVRFPRGGAYSLASRLGLPGTGKQRCTLRP